MRGRRRRSRTDNLIALGAFALFAVVALPGQAGERQAPPDYTRSEPDRAPRRHAVHMSPPEALRYRGPATGVDAVDTRAESAGARGRAAPGRPGRSNRLEQIRELARDAAVWTAGHLVDSRGRREYFRVGFHDGLRQALQDASIGDRDYRDGERRGWRDPQARDEGARLGRADAAVAARSSAPLQVEQQFADLDRSPRYSPLPPHPGYEPAPPFIPEPTLGEVFADFPMRQHLHTDPRLAVFLDGWTYDAAQLYGCEAYVDFYDARWSGPDHAFEYWTRRPGLSASYAGLADEQERALFRQTFAEIFARRVATLYARRLLPAFEAGFDEGWAYGAFAHGEWDYRRGLHAGFTDARLDAARAAFDRAYPERYEAVYRAHFDDWSRNPKPAIGSVWLVDGNRDGVFEPGEELSLDYELINYGGGAGSFPVRLEGPVLSASETVRVELPPRAILRNGEALRARIDPLTPNRTDASLELALAGLARDLEIRVTHPLQLQRGAWRVRRQNLDGRVVLEVDVENLSSRPVEGSLELTTASLPGRAVLRNLGPVEPGDVRRLALPVSDLDPLDLLAGRVSLAVDLRGNSALHDSFRYHIPDAARDLANRDLLIFVVQLAQDGHASPARIATTRDLLMTRLREDWKVAAMRRGNPYKFDYRNDAATTALGDLVRTYQLQSPNVRNHQVFAGLSTDIKALAKRLPGIHPFLRKSVRKLARELP